MQNPMKYPHAAPYMVTHTLGPMMSTLLPCDVSSLCAYEMILKLYTCKEDLYMKKWYTLVISEMTEPALVIHLLSALPDWNAGLHASCSRVCSTYADTHLIRVQCSIAHRVIGYRQAHLLCTPGSTQIPLVMDSLYCLSRCFITLTASVELLPDIVLHTFIIT